MTHGILRRAKMDVEESSSRTFQRLERTCLSCSTTFDSAWAGERICLRCKGSSAWRVGISTSTSGSNHSHARSGRRAAS